jgi:hypothetical protein
MAYEGAVGGGAIGGCGCCGTPSFCGIAIVTVIILLLIAMGILF